MNRNKVYIQCGITSEQIKENNLLFWPVAQAVALPFSWKPVLNQNYSLVFTSKHAVHIFAQEILQKNTETNLFCNLEHICAVGASTAQVVKSVMALYLSPKIIEDILYPKEEGLFNLFTQTNFVPNSLIYIFTASNGKTVETLKSLPENLRYNTVPVYQLEPFASPFLEELFSKENKQEKTQYVFYCRSGFVLKTALSLLQNYFQCKESKKLPKNIFFAGEKQSVKNEIQQLDLIDRIIS